MREVTDAVCPGCGCGCDDLTLVFDGNQLESVSPDCPLAQSWFHDNARVSGSTVQIAGVDSSLEAAVTKAAEILENAEYPLIYGLSRSCTSGQRAAVRLADRLGAVIDTTASICHGPSIIAVQSVGESTCSLGEVRNRSDLVIYWGCNPARTHPRHAERYAVFPRGQFVPEGRQGRTVIMVGDAGEVQDCRLDLTGSQPDLVVPIQSGKDFEAINILRALLKGIQPNPDEMLSACAIPGLLQLLADKMKSCRSGVVFFGLGLTETSFDKPHAPSVFGHANVECLLRLVAELNAFTRFYARRLRVQGDVSGADTVLCWQTGFPFSVNLTHGFPRYNPGEYSAMSLLERGEPDACLLVGTETLPAFPPGAMRHLKSIPTIVLDYPAAEAFFTPSVHITTAPYGLQAGGTIYRMDEIPLPLHAHQMLQLPTDEDVLQQFASVVSPRPATQ